MGEPESALAVYDRLTTGDRVFDRPAILLRQANAAVELDAHDTAVRVYRVLYYDYPLSDSGLAAAAALEETGDTPRPIAGSDTYARELARANQLFAGRRYAEAGKAFERLVAVARGDERDRLDLRVAESDYFLRRYRPARDRARRQMDGDGPFRAEATYYWALSVKALRATDAYVGALKRILDEDPDSPFVEDALNELGTSYIVDDKDEQADLVFRQILDRFPTGRFAERAAWRTGWWSYRHGRYAETIQIFERAAAAFPRSDYRPSWLYWLGRAYEAGGDAAHARERYALTLADYRNSYYGRLAAARLTVPPPRRVPVGAVAVAGQAPAPPPAPPANIGVIRALLAAGLFTPAVDELRYGQAMWGDSPALQATLAWALNRRGDLRPAINTMKRAYPQYLADGGADLPRDVRTILFPLEYWDLIQKHAAEHDLDPYLMAALVAQESNFDPGIRSPANAYGLMQLLPATARRYAPRVGLRYSSRLLTDPDANIRMGMAYFADLVGEFGDVHLALAGYNAGERRVEAWRTERPGLAREEFIDDIPFPETQNYVKRILGTAEDYRLLY